jgi:hypothetical protein
MTSKQHVAEIKKETSRVQDHLRKIMRSQYSKQKGQLWKPEKLRVNKYLQTVL